jgi:hypothetical protein
MKIEIINRFTGSVIFSHDQENNSTLITLKLAISSGANLYGANLRGADLYGANLCGANLCGANLYGANLYGANLCGANLCGANLYGANLRGADLFGEKLKKSPVLIENLHWSVTITDVHMKIGCQLHAIDDWRSFSDDEISRMSSQALDFWQKHKVSLLALCDAHGADE